MLKCQGIFFYLWSHRAYRSLFCLPVFVKISIQINLCKVIGKNLQCQELQEEEGVVQGGGTCFLWMFLCRCIKAKRCKDMGFYAICVGGVVSAA
jgi:hypothetical protein